MTVSDTDVTRGAADEFNQARTDAREGMTAQRIRAARTVAGYATDPEDCLTLLRMLGLDEDSEAPDSARPVHVAPVL
ncbi:hypothetical protein UO65_2010 [Actinokineospora spheciospongiae]|uniref:Uncharacterized protein n=1 Tax=Actinokineospora spheciospongiae TaxID=909613 RepID=W7IQJ6_9PSEU|nr:MULTISPECIES: hypothetical protein [Actinokineospora]EWC62658.1 hypothetical protein UO65_2010 [Actinokineospora spheciospongiae]MCG8918325.1 hypothetical protein [Actinokineospora sp. PR83]PWW54194.1 hypothetical protein DFQ13_11470 [Actinokineospora spheciospongiae]